jgi:hypothetical protein
MYISVVYSRFKLDPSYAKCPGSGTEIVPGKHSDTRTKPLPLNFNDGHGRYITVTPERTLLSVGEWPLHTYQRPRFISDPFVRLTALEEAEIIPDKDPDTRIKPLALTNGHGRYMTVTPERTLASVGGCPLNI